MQQQQTGYSATLRSLQFNCSEIDPHVMDDAGKLGLTLRKTLDSRSRKGNWRQEWEVDLPAGSSVGHNGTRDDEFPKKDCPKEHPFLGGFGVCLPSHYWYRLPTGEILTSRPFGILTYGEDTALEVSCTLGWLDEKGQMYAGGMKDHRYIVAHLRKESTFEVMWHLTRIEEKATGW